MVNLLVNYMLVAAGATIGIIVSSLLQINKLNDEKRTAYKRGYANGKRDSQRYEFKHTIERKPGKNDDL